MNIYLIWYDLIQISPKYYHVVIRHMLINPNQSAIIMPSGDKSLSLLSVCNTLSAKVLPPRNKQLIYFSAPWGRKPTQNFFTSRQLWGSVNIISPRADREKVCPAAFQKRRECVRVFFDNNSSKRPPPRPPPPVHHWCVLRCCLNESDQVWGGGAERIKG